MAFGFGGEGCEFFFFFFYRDISDKAGRNWFFGNEVLAIIFFFFFFFFFFFLRIRGANKFYYVNYADCARFIFQVEVFTIRDVYFIAIKKPSFVVMVTN